MNTTSAALLNYWPRNEEVNRCIQPIAEGAHEAVLLAVHQPSPLSYRTLPSGEKRGGTEDDLFAYFTSQDVSTGVHLVPITGASGVGKSHLVRLLELKLHTAAEAERYLVIRIPKTASLREVVRLILAPLAGETYDPVRQAFSKALDEVRTETAVIDFQAKLEIALEALGKKLKSQFEESPNPILRDKLGHVLALPKFMRDVEVAEHFRSSVFRKIVKRAIAGQGNESETGSVKDFSEQDFVLPDSVDLDKASDAARRYYLQLQSRGGVGMRIAADLLNDEVVDEAIRQLFHLNESLGGMTLQDVILEIRRKLLSEDRELVILVEDFRALTGIQETLLNLLIQEGVVHGKREYATMRSAIAVTDGYLTGQDTIATRAKREWTVESRLEDQDDILLRTRRMVAAYLDAARHGEEKLVRHYAAHVGNHAVHSALTPYSDPDRDCADDLAAFGYEGEIPLFPFTPLAIANLARGALTQNDKLIFTPRFVIDNVLRDILLNTRHAYAEGQFPPATMQLPSLAAPVAQWMQKQNLSGEQRRRYATLVAIWGDDPQSVGDIARIPAGVFKAFGLPAPELDETDLASATSAAPRTSPGAREGNQEEGTERGNPVRSEGGEGLNGSVIQPSSGPTAEEVRFKEALEAWVANSERLPSGPANDIRICLAVAIGEQLDWNSERCIKIPIGSSQISIHDNAQGELGISNRVVRITEDTRDSSGQLRSELLALVRLYKFNKKSETYAEIDDDMARVANLVARLLPQVLRNIREQNAAYLRSSARALIANSRALGVTERARTLASLPPFLFGGVELPTPPTEFAPQVFKEWRMVQEEAIRARPELIRLVLSRCGCYQGDGDIAYAYDVARLVELIPTDDVKPERIHFPQEVWQQIVDNSETRLLPRARKLLVEAQRIGVNLRKELGDSFDKHAVIEAMKQLVDTMVRIAHWDSDALGQPARYRKLCEDFRGLGVKDALAKLDEAFASNEDQKETRFLSRIAQLDINPLTVAEAFIEESRRIVVNANKEAAALDSSLEGVDPMVQANQLEAVFESLQATLGAIELEEGSNAGN